MAKGTEGMRMVIIRYSLDSSGTFFQVKPFERERTVKASAIPVPSSVEERKDHFLYDGILI